MVGSVSTGVDPQNYLPRPSLQPSETIPAEQVSRNDGQKIAQASRDEKSRLNAASQQSDSLQKLVEQMGYEVTYGLYEGTSEFYAKITDPRTDKVIRMIPPEEWLKLSANLGEVVGRILDKEA